MRSFVSSLFRVTIYDVSIRSKDQQHNHHLTAYNPNLVATVGAISKVRLTREVLLVAVRFHS